METNSDSSVEDLLLQPLFGQMSKSDSIIISEDSTNNDSSISKLDNIKNEGRLTQSLETESYSLEDDLSQELSNLSALKGQLAFNMFTFPTIPIQLPLFSEKETKENPLLSSLEEYVTSCREESSTLFYKELLLTNALIEMDSMCQLPPSIYKMLYSIAIYSKDEVSSIRAYQQLTAMISSHYQNNHDFMACLPDSTFMLDVWKQFGYIEDGCLDLTKLVQNHTITSSMIQSEGFISPSFLSSFPITQFDHYLQFLLMILNKTQSKIFYFTDSQLQQLLERLLLTLLEPRTLLLYDLQCSILAALTTIITNRHMLLLTRLFINRKIRSVLEDVFSPKMIPEISCLQLLLIRIPVSNPTLSILRNVASFIVLNRITK